MMMAIVYLVQKDYLDLTPEGPHKISIILAFHQEHNHGYMILITTETLSPLRPYWVTAQTRPVKPDQSKCALQFSACDKK